MHATLNLVFRQVGKEALDLIDPGTRSRREVDVPARMSGKPSSNRRRLMGRGVVDYQMDFEIGQDVVLDFPQERQELTRAMTRKAPPDDLARRHVESGKQR